MPHTRVLSAAEAALIRKVLALMLCAVALACGSEPTPELVPVHQFMFKPISVDQDNILPADAAPAQQVFAFGLTPGIRFDGDNDDAYYVQKFRQVRDDYIVPLDDWAEIAAKVAKPATAAQLEGITVTPGETKVAESIVMAFAQSSRRPGNRYLDKYSPAFKGWTMRGSSHLQHGDRVVEFIYFDRAARLTIDTHPRSSELPIVADISVPEAGFYLLAYARGAAQIRLEPVALPKRLLLVTHLHER